MKRHVSGRQQFKVPKSIQIISKISSFHLLSSYHFVLEVSSRETLKHFVKRDHQLCIVLCGGHVLYVALFNPRT